MKQVPKVCFGFAVLNEEIDLPRCLASIRNQTYPQENVEIVLADGGSRDRTKEIAADFDCIVIDNPQIRAEPGAVLAHKYSDADIKVFFAADNELPNRNWIRDMVEPFISDERVFATFTHISVPPSDNSLNKYYSMLHVEPFTWFIYGRRSNPALFDDVYPSTVLTPSYEVYEFTPMTHPLLALAQGFCVRGSFDREAYNHEDDIIPVIELIKEQKLMAYVPTAGVHHFHLSGLKDFVKKYNWRIKNSLTTDNVGFANRSEFQPASVSIKKYLWLVYSFSIVLPFVQSCYWSLSARKCFPLWHAPICLLLSSMIVVNVIKTTAARLQHGFKAISD